MVTVVAATVALLALWAADGAVRVSRDTFRTEFIDVAVWNLAWLLVVPVFVATRTWPRLAVAWVAAAALPQFVAAYVTVARYVRSGWSDGLEIFAFVWPIFMTGAYAVAAVLAARLRPRDLNRSY